MLEVFRSLCWKLLLRCYAKQRLILLVSYSLFFWMIVRSTIWARSKHTHFLCLQIYLVRAWDEQNAENIAIPPSAQYLQVKVLLLDFDTDVGLISRCHQFNALQWRYMHVSSSIWPLILLISSIASFALANLSAECVSTHMCHHKIACRQKRSASALSAQRHQMFFRFPTTHDDTFPSATEPSSYLCIVIVFLNQHHDDWSHTLWLHNIIKEVALKLWVVDKEGRHQ